MYINLIGEGKLLSRVALARGVLRVDHLFLIPEDDPVLSQQHVGHTDRQIQCHVCLNTNISSAHISYEDHSSCRD